MAYIGRDTDKISNIEILDNITFDGSSSYSITKSSVAFTPNSAQSLLISIDGVVQAGNFTVSGSTIDFGVAIPSTSTCDFFLHYGTGLITTPADGTVTTAKIGSNAVTSTKLSYPLTTFSSTGIDDNATANALTIDSSSNLQFNSGYGSVATAYGCRAWVNFNGTGTVSIRASGNVSSITDNGTGNYTVNFTTAMPDVDYSAAAINLVTPGVSRKVTEINKSVITVSTVGISTSGTYGGAAADNDYVYLAIFR